MRQVIKHFKLDKKAKAGLIRFQTDGKLSVLGKYDGGLFEGSDRLSMAVMKDCAMFEKVRAKNEMIVVCEGDRFTNKTFIETCKPYIIKLLDDGSAGRIARKSNQSERHIKSIRTRVSNIKADKAVKDSSEAFEVIREMICKELT
tara:strand:+ start:990 stop:1424 length:435 start_codon:yes stop_codon:yes gene_type:complete